MDKRIVISLLVLMLCALTLGCVQSPTEEGAPTAEQEVYIVHMAPPTMLDELKCGDIDAFIAWEPFNAEAAVDGYARYLINSSEIWPHHPCCVVASSESSYKNERLLTAIVWAHIKATRFINNPDNYNKTAQYAMEFTGKDRKTAETALSNIEFVEYPSVDEFKNYYYRLEDGHLLKKSVEDIGYSDDDAFFEDFLNQSYYHEVVQKLDDDPSWVPPPVSSNEIVRVGHLSADLHQMAVHVAVQEGYFEQVGLVKDENLFIKGTYVNGVAAMEAFKNNEIDVCYLGGAPATLKRINDNTKIHVIAGANDVGSSIMVGADSDIHTTKELAGKIVATPGVGTVQDFIVRQMAQENGFRVVLK